MVQELVKKSSHSSPEASLDTETGETDASPIARVQTAAFLTIFCTEQVL